MAHHPPKGTPNLDNKMLFLIGVCSVLMLITTIAAIWAGFEFAWTNEVYQKQTAPAYRPLVEHNANQAALLDGSAQGSTSIQQAMKKITAPGNQGTPGS